MVISLAGLTGCGKPAEKSADGQPAGESGAKPEKLHVVWGTSGIAGSWYPTASAIAGVVMKHSDSMITVQSTGGGTENLRLMKQGEIGLALAEANVMNYAFKGEKLFEGDAYPDMRFVTQLYPIVFQVAVHANSPYKTIADLKGNGFSPGSAGSGDEACYEEIVAEYGLTKKDLDWRPLAHTERSMAFKDRQLDSIGFETSVPAGALLEACAQNPIRLLPIEGKERESLKSKYSWYTDWNIPAGIYNGQDTEIETVATMSMVVADKSVPDQLIYDFITSLYADLEPVHAVHKMTPYISLETALLGQGDIPLHPGAEKAYKELGLIK
jgi:TRAP transporter TAXI family solute receptor